MRKFLRSRDILFLTLANMLDAAEEIKDPLRLMSSSYENMYGWIPGRYKRHNFYQLVSRSLKTKHIEKIEKDEKIYMRITSEGRKTIQRDFPMLLLQNRSWDGKWRIVMFDVEEANKKIREKLRSKLKELGFGMLQKSVFVSPHDIAKDFMEFAQASGISEYLCILESRILMVGNEREFANKVWKLEDLNAKYEGIIDEIEDAKNKYMISNSDRIKKSDIQREKNMRSVRNKWLMTVAQDPFLPKKLLPKIWHREKAEKLVKGLE